MISRGHSWGLAYFPDVSYRDTYLANPMSDNQFMLASGNAVLRHLFQRTVMLVDTNDLPYAERRWITFSGTLIRIGDRIFVATVSHTLENVENPTRYSLMAMTGHNHQNSNRVFRKTIGTENDRPDVGLMELDLDILATFCENESIGTNRISVAPPECNLSTLMGIPTSTVELSENESGQWGLYCTASGFSTAAIEIDSWPSMNLETPLDPEIDLLVGYPDRSADIRDMDGNQTDLDNPKGLSGGGLWVHGHSDQGSELWTPESCKLVGIQSGWIRSREFVRLARISHWLELVWRNYPDLREAIETEIEGFVPPE